MGFGIILKRKREECNFSQEEVAKRMGISQKTISAWETERNIPKLDDYVKMAEIYNCTIHELSGQKTDISTITLQDILIKLPDFSIDELKEIKYQIDKVLTTKIRMKELEDREAEMRQRLQEYQKEIEKLRKNAYESKKD